MEIQQTEQIYKILVMGANGGIGRQCVELALQAGHHVTAILRSPDKLPISNPNLQIIKGDIMQPETYEKYLAGKDAVISAIGTSGGFGKDKPTQLYSKGSETLLQAMKKADVQRIFLISASAIEISPVLPFYVRLAEKYIVQKLLKNMYDDLRKMEALVKENDANWTIIRPPQLKDRPVTGHYRVAVNQFLKNCLSISRADVAHYILHNIDTKETFKATVEIGY